MSTGIKTDSLFEAARGISLISGEGGLTPQQQEEEDNICPSLTFEQRLIGFCVCFALGFLFSIFAWVAIFSLDFNTFAVINTLANITSIGSTLFLCGPMTQLKRMFDSTRLIATIVYLSAMVLTFVVALALHNPWLTIITVIVQYLAMVWYCLSYIPFARTAILRFVGLS
ncbi:putative transmembrane protein [Trypanosoma theileri]|uniref:Vesicle transport protein n=1 Tax=Trypanosoma theileri TaxID=67003 RepID=A0A1X0P315_9TRYP|nr:putative transmembrane protein [Trypanosoma theileri]ORC91317.1 putative transmembrane protein [Trypanosoma theileri]